VKAVKKGALAFALVTVVLFALGCVMTAPVVPPPALVQSYQAPLDIDHAETQLGTKVGRSSTSNVLGLVSWGDGSTRAAAQNGGITTIRTADYEFVSYLGIYSQYTTIVHGD
jgi:hypothetical protein